MGNNKSISYLIRPRPRGSLFDQRPISHKLVQLNLRASFNDIIKLFKWISVTRAPYKGKEVVSKHTDLTFFIGKFEFNNFDVFGRKL